LGQLDGVVVAVDAGAAARRGGQLREDALEARRDDGVVLLGYGGVGVCEAEVLLPGGCVGLGGFAHGDCRPVLGEFDGWDY